MTRLLPRALAALSFLLTIVGAAGVVLGVLGPWAAFTVFHNIDLSLPGFFFLWGGLCLAVAILVLLGARRFPVLCLAGAVCVLVWTQDARRDVPHTVRHQVIGAQLALFPLNRLLDQFHIADVSVWEPGELNADLLGPGLAWTQDGGWLLLLGGLAGLPSDPAAVWAWTRTARARCRACGARWPLHRPARYCPACGAPAVPPGVRLCPACHAEAARGDRHCVACGTALG